MHDEKLYIVAQGSSPGVYRTEKEFKKAIEKQKSSLGKSFLPSELKQAKKWCKRHCNNLDLREKLIQSFEMLITEPANQKPTYYVVFKGAEVGIKSSQQALNKAIGSYSNPVYQAFSSSDEAKRCWKQFATQPKNQKKKIITEVTNKPYKNVAYTDGSYNHEKNICGYACLLMVDGIAYPNLGQVDRQYNDLQNVAGEIYAAKVAIEKALKHGLKELSICFDFEGVKTYLDNPQKSHPLINAYRDCYNKARTVMQINFIHCKAHTGIPGNVQADKLAKIASGVQKI